MGFGDRAEHLSGPTGPRAPAARWRHAAALFATAAALSGIADLSGDGDIVIILSGRNADESQFREWINV